MSKAVDIILDCIRDEVYNAKAKHPGDFHNFHEAYAVLLEEVDEVKAEVWKSKHDHTKLYVEAVQVAAMAVRLASELCGDAMVPEMAHRWPSLERFHQRTMLTGAVERPAGTVERLKASANTDPQKSAQSCGCDPGINYVSLSCEKHRRGDRRCDGVYVFDANDGKDGREQCVRPNGHMGTCRSAEGHLFVSQPVGVPK